MNIGNGLGNVTNTHLVTCEEEAKSLGSHRSKTTISILDSLAPTRFDGSNPVSSTFLQPTHELKLSAP